MISPARRSALPVLRQARLLSWALGLVLVGTTAGARADDGAAAVERTAILFFVSSPGEFALSIDATEVRRTASARVEMALLEAGGPILGALEIEPIMRQHRVRSEGDLRPAFFETLVTDYDVSRLAVFRAILSENRALFLARAIDPHSGLLTWTGAADIVVDAVNWRSEATSRAELDRVAIAAADEIASQWDDRSSVKTRRNVVLLPLRTEGLGRAAAEVASHCLLHSLLENAGWSIPEAAVVMRALQLAQLDPTLLDANSRAELSRRFAVDAVLVPRMLSFPAGGVRATPSFGASDEGSAAIETIVSTPVYLSLSLVDCESGEVVAGHAAYLKPQDPVGMFGIPKETHLLNHIQNGADGVVRALIARERDD